MSFNRWGSIVDGVDPVNTTETSFSAIRSDEERIYPAIPDEPIEDFEDGDISEYTGDTGIYSTITSDVINGSYSLEAYISSNTTRKWLYGLNKTVERGIAPIRWWVKNEKNVCRIVFMAQSETAFPNGYDCGINFNTNSITLNPQGTTTDSVSTDVSLSFNQWYEPWFNAKNDGEIAFGINDSSGNVLASVSTNDNTYDSGGLAFGARTTNSGPMYSRWDYIRYEE